MCLETRTKQKKYYFWGPSPNLSKKKFLRNWRGRAISYYLRGPGRLATLEIEIEMVSHTTSVALFGLLPQIKERFARAASRIMHDVVIFVVQILGRTFFAAHAIKKESGSIQISLESTIRDGLWNQPEQSKASERSWTATR